MSSLICCPGCTHKLTLPDDFIGRRVQCPKCLVDFEAHATATPAMEVESHTPSVVAPTPDADPAPPSSETIPQAQAAPPLQTGYAPVAKTTNRAPAPAPDGERPFYCVECGTKYPRTDDACPSCGFRNYDRLAERRDQRRRPRPRDMPPLHSWLALAGTILIPVGIGIMFVGVFMANEMRGWRPGMRDFVGFLGVGVGGLAVLAALVCILIWLYQAWRIVTHGDEEYSPGLMVGMLFVPFFNLYWIFRAIPGLSSALQRELQNVAPRRPASIGYTPGMLACIFLLIPYMQPIALCMFLAWMLLTDNAAQRLVRLHEQLAREQAEPADKLDV